MHVILKRILDLLTTTEKRRLVWLIALILMASLFEAFSVGSIQPFLALVTNPEVIQQNAILNNLYNWFGFSDDQKFMIFIGIVFLLIIIVTNVLAALSVWRQLRYAWNLNHSLSTRLLQRYLSRPYGYFLYRHSSELTKHIVQESQGVIRGTVIPGLDLLANATKTAAIIGLLLILEPAITVYTVAVLGGAYGTFYLKVRNPLKSAGAKSLIANKNRHKISAEAFGGIKDVKLLGRERYFIDRFKPHSRAYARHHANNQIVRRLPRFVMQVLAFGGLTLVLLYLVSAGRDLTEIAPVIGMFAFAGLRLIPSLQFIVSALTQFKFSERLVRVIHRELIGTEDEHPIEDGRGVVQTQTSPLAFEREIRLDRVSFQYLNTETPTLNNISVTIKKNTSAAFVGQTGAGKTTLIDIFLGLHTPQSGSVCIDGVRLTDNNRSSWQKNIGYVAQEIFLCDDTIRRNIAFGVPDDAIDIAAVEHAARIAHIHDVIVSELPAGYDTEVGERGVRLSGGQRQRIGIARALYHDPDILVFDEATSDIDGVTEAAITQAIDELTGEKTLIIIAHRLQTIRNCDTIYLMSNGRIDAQGTFDALTASNAGFHALATQQVAVTG